MNSIIFQLLCFGHPHHMPDRLQYYNGAHIVIMMMPIMVFCLVYFLMRKRSIQSKQKALIIMSFMNIVIFISFKAVMAFTYPTFDIWGELPLQLCNINIFILPIALFTKKRSLFSYLFFIGSIGAMCAFPFFDVYFLGRPVVSYPIIAFFMFHAFLVAMPILIVSFGLYTPAFKDIFASIVILLILALTMHCVNLLFINTGLCPEANYFYTMGMEGNPLIDKLWHLIPRPFLFFLPVLIPLIPVNMLMALPFYLKEKRDAKPQASVEDE